VKFHDGSSPVTRFCADGMVVRHELVGDYGGEVNLDGGRSGWPVHGEVAGARSGEVAGEATGRNKRRGSVC
jgi:hypothetical protein